MTRSKSKGYLRACLGLGVAVALTVGGVMLADRAVTAVNDEPQCQQLCRDRDLAFVSCTAPVRYKEGVCSCRDADRRVEDFPFAPLLLGTTVLRRFVMLAAGIAIGALLGLVSGRLGLI